MWSTKELIQQVRPQFNCYEATEQATQEWQNSRHCPIPEEQSRASQKAWDLPAVSATFNFLLEASTNPERARLLAVSAAEWGLWLDALPAVTLGNHLEEAHLRFAVALRLGTPICQEHRCRCGKNVDSLGRHGLSCEKSAGRQSRHSSINEIIKRALVSADFHALREPQGREPLLRSTETRRNDTGALVAGKKFDLGRHRSRHPRRKLYPADFSRTCCCSSESRGAEKVQVYFTVLKIRVRPFSIRDIRHMGPRGSGFCKEGRRTLVGQKRRPQVNHVF